jgi:hypothetical protein
MGVIPLWVFPVWRYDENSYIYLYICIYIYILRGFKTSDDAFRLSYSIAFDCSIRPFLDLFHSWLYTGCPRRILPDFGRMFLMLKYTDITQNTYIQSWTFTEIMAREKCGLLAVPRTVPVKLTRYPYTAHVRPWECNAVNVATAT